MRKILVVSILLGSLSVLFGCLVFFRSDPPSVAILIHGCHLETKNWDEIMFGNESQEGRVTSGIDEALKQRAGLILWGSGASQTNEQMKESEFTFLQATSTHLDQLANHFHLSPSHLSTYLKKTSLLQIKEKNTAEEIQSALAICEKRKIKNLVLISSPTHIARCLQEGCKQKYKKENQDIRIYARSSDVCFINSTPQDVIIVEPPHRADRPQIPIHELFKKIFYLLKENEAQKLYADLMQLVSERESERIGS